MVAERLTRSPREGSLLSGQHLVCVFQHLRDIRAETAWFGGSAYMPICLDGMGLDSEPRRQSLSCFGLVC